MAATFERDKSEKIAQNDVKWETLETE